MKQLENVTDVRPAAPNTRRPGIGFSAAIALLVACATLHPLMHLTNQSSYAPALVTSGLLGILSALLVGNRSGRLALLPPASATADALDCSVRSRDEAEAALRISEQRFRTLVRATSIVTWTCPPSGLHDKPQPEWMAFTGQTAEEVLGTGWANAVHPDDRGLAASRWADAVARSVPFSSEVRIRRHDGAWRWVNTQAAPIRDETGSIVEWVGMCADVTERRLADEQLRRSQDTLRIAKTAARAGLFDLDFETDRLDCDERLRELWGFSADEEISQGSIYGRMHPEDLAAVQDEVAKALDPDSGGTYRSVYRVQPGGGAATRWIEATGQVFFEGTRPVRAVGSVLDITERQETEARIAQLARQRQQALDAARLGWWQYDPASQKVVWDKTCNAILGNSGEVSDVEPFKPTLIHPADASYVWSRMLAALDPVASQPYEVEYRILRPDGQTRWVKAMGVTSFEGEGAARKAREVVGTVADITEAKLAGQQLEQSRKRLQLAQAAAKLGIFDLDLHAKTAFGDEKLQEILGFDSRNPIGIDEYVARIHPDDLEKRAAAHAKAIDPTGDGHYQAIYRILRKNDDAVRWIEATGQAYFEDGRAVRLVGTVLDITERKQAVMALRESKERLRSVTDNASVGLVTLDRDRRYTFVNPAYVRILDLAQSPDELVGSGPEQALPSIYAKQIAPCLDRAFAGERVSYELSRPAGRGSRQYTVVYDPTRDSDGEIVGVIVVIFDITERKQAEDLLARSAGLRAVGQLASGIAHDFGNLLTVISGNLQLAELHLDRGKALAFVQRALDAAERGASFNRRLLSLAGQRHRHAAPIDVNAQVEQTARLLRRTLGEPVSIRLELAAVPCPAVIDPSELESALLNLALNARDAMPEGGVLTLATETVHLDVAPQSDGQTAAGTRDGEYVRIRVEDTGFGMSPDELRLAREPFFTTKSPGKGTGLGLTSVQRTAEAAGGFLDVESTPGRGTSASLYLPRDGAVLQAESRAQDPERRRGAGELILVVDDDPDVREVVAKRLTSLGYAVRSASSGPEAMAILEHDADVRLLFSDMVLPDGISGIDLAREISERKPGMAVLLTSASASDLEPGKTPVLGKPYSMAQLAEAIHIALNGPASSRSAPEQI